MVTHSAAWTSPPADEEGLIAWFRAKCDHDPVQRNPKNGGWHIFGYAETMEALSNHAAFSSRLTTTLPEGSAFKLYRVGNLSWMDPPRHRQLRALVSRVFTPRYVADLEPMVVSTVDEFMRNIRGKSTIAYVEEYASPVVSTVIARMVGIPSRGHELFRNWSKDLMALIDPSTRTNGLRAVATNTRVIDYYLHELISRRRREPRDDLISGLIASEVDGEKLADDEIAGLIALLLSTGQSATLTLVNAIICLDQCPEAAARLRSDRSLLGSAIDEVMRYRNQTTSVARHTVEDVTVGGHTIPSGQSVSVWLAAANRDARRFEHPDTFDLDRAPNPHLALGHGIHFCLGAHLARLEITTALDRLLEGTSDFAVSYADSRLLDPRLIFGASEISLKVGWR